MVEKTFYRNDTIVEKVSFNGYSSSDYTLYVAVRGADSSLSTTARSISDGWNVSIDTSTLATGTYTVYYYIQTNGKRVVLESYTLTIKADFLTGSVAEEISFARQALTILEEQIKRCGAAGYISKSIGGHTTQRITLTELLKQRDAILLEIEIEEADNRRKRGEPGYKTLQYSFR